MIRNWLLIFLSLPVILNAQQSLTRLHASGDELLDQGHYSDAIRLFKQGLRLAIAEKEPREEAVLLANIAFAYLVTDAIDSAITYAVLGKSAGIRARDSLVTGSCCLHLGMLYRKQGQYVQSIKELQLAIDLFSGLHDDERLASAFNTMGNVQNSLRRFKQAIYYYNRTLAIHMSRKQLADPGDIAAVLSNMGDLYKEFGHYTQARAYMLRSLEYKYRLDDPKSLAHTLVGMGEVDQRLGNYPEALRYFHKAYTLRKAHADWTGIANSANLLAACYLEQGNFDQAKKLLDESREVAGAYGLQAELLKAYDLSRKLYREMGQLEDALHFDDLFIHLNEWMLNAGTLRDAAEMDAKYETREKDRKYLFLQQKMKISTERNYWLAGSVILLAALIMIMYRAYVQKKRGKERTENLMRELNHRVKNNLQVLISMLGLQEEELTDPAARRVIAETRSRVLSMSLVHKRLYLSKEVSFVNLDRFIKEQTEELAVGYGYKPGDRLNLQFELEETNISADKAISLALIIQELLSNAFKYAFPDNKNPELHIALRHSGKELSLVIQDNGPGIQEHDHQKDSFGFKLMQVLIRQLKATLEMRNENGLRVTVFMPTT